jgi:glucosamine-6-phosphate deaminase
MRSSAARHGERYSDSEPHERVWRVNCHDSVGILQVPDYRPNTKIAMHHTVLSTSVIAGIRITVFADRTAAELAAADRIAGLLDERRLRGLSVVLGLSTGRTPIGIYRELVARARTRHLSFAHVETFNLDEYWPMELARDASFHRFMHHHLFDHVDLPRGKRHIPNGSADGAELDVHVKDYENQIRAAGGIDLQLLGIGRNGHIGFNEPGASRDSRTRRVELTRDTLDSNRADFANHDSVPQHAITMGIATILEARQILVLAFGEAKAEIVRATLLGPITSAVPASFLREHGPPPAVDLFLDPAAAALL